MEYPAVRALPLRTFWSLNRQVDRLRAESEQRQLRLLSAAENPESAKKLSDALSTQINNPVVYEKKFDGSRFEELQKRFSSKGQVVTNTQTE